MTRADDLLLAITVHWNCKPSANESRKGLWWEVWNGLMESCRAYLAEPQQEDARDAARYRWARRQLANRFGNSTDRVDAAADAALAAKPAKCEHEWEPVCSRDATGEVNNDWQRCIKCGAEQP